MGYLSALSTLKNFATPSFFGSDDDVQYSPDDDSSQPSGLYAQSLPSPSIAIGDDPGASATAPAEAYQAESPAKKASEILNRTKLAREDAADGTVDNPVDAATDTGADYGFKQRPTAPTLTPSGYSYGGYGSQSPANKGGISTIPASAFGSPANYTGGSSMPLTDRYLADVQAEANRPAPSFRKQVLAALASKAPIIGGPLSQHILDPDGPATQQRLAIEKLGSQAEESQQRILGTIANRDTSAANRDYLNSLRMTEEANRENNRRAMLAQQQGAAADRFATAGGMVVPYGEGQQDTTLTAPQAPPDLASPEAIAPPVTRPGQQGPGVLPPDLAPLLRRNGIPGAVPAQTQLSVKTPADAAVPSGYNVVPQAAQQMLQVPANQRAILPTAAEAARQKQASVQAEKEADYVPTPKAVLDAFGDGMPPKMPLDKAIQASETVARMLDSRAQHEDNMQLKQSLADQSAALRREMAGMSRGQADEKQLDKQFAQYGAPHNKALAEQESQLSKIDDAMKMSYAGNAVAQALLVPKLLSSLVGGQGSGLRMTKSELDSIIHARGIEGDFEGWMNKMSNKGTLTKDQVAKMQGILSDVRSRLQEKAQIHADALTKMRGADNRKGITDADQEAQDKLMGLEKGSGGKIIVTAPDGSKHPFDTQQQADAFKALARIK